MYNFRYHLVTIVSIFVSLLIGLVLGAAIAGSDLVRNTSNEMVESLLKRFDELSAQNAKLQNRLNNESALAQEYFEKWTDGRLEGRIIVLLVSEANASSAAIKEIQETLSISHATTITITVKEPSFGVQTPAIQERMRAIIAPIEGELYEDTIARKLVDEWTYVYRVRGSDPEGATQNGLAGTGEASGDEGGAGSTSGTGGTGDTSGTGDAGSTGSTSGTGGSGGTRVVSQAQIEQDVYQRYPLTRFLLTNGIISIEVDYQPLLEQIGATSYVEQKLALQYVASLQLPYAANGVIDTLTIAASGNAAVVDPVGVQIATEFEQRGGRGVLPYPPWLRRELAELVGTEVAADDGSYYTILVDVDAVFTNLASTAYTRDLSCVTTPAELIGRYSIIALLSGAPRGVYGQDRAAAERFPSLPVDTTGRIPFAS